MCSALITSGATNDLHLLRRCKFRAERRRGIGGAPAKRKRSLRPRGLPHLTSLPAGATRLRLLT